MATDRPLEPLPVDPAHTGSALTALSDALDGRGPAWLPVPARDRVGADRLTRAFPAGTDVPADTALVTATSGTTGTPKGALLPAAALRASAAATHDRLGGPGTWLLALPAHHIAGIQVLIRSLDAGTIPAVLDVTDGFDPAALAAAAQTMAPGRRYTALVPGQLIKALAHPAATAALAGFDAILLGGAPTPGPVLDRARAAGLRPVRTYGMSETCGGCVYDGRPLPGTRVRLDREDGRIVLGGATLASGYLGLPDHPAFAEPGWFRTDDAGRIDDDGALSVVGRLDEAFTSGGLTVVPQVIEELLTRLPGVAECAVVGLPDPRLGHRIVAAVVPAAGAAAPSADQVRAAIAPRLGDRAVPRQIVTLTALPRRGPGKLDRRALTARLTEPGPTG